MVYLTTHSTQFIYSYMASDKYSVINLPRKEMVYLTTHSTHFIYGYMASEKYSVVNLPRKEMFYFMTHSTHFIYGYMAKDRQLRCHYTKSNPIDDHNNISSKTLQKQNFKPLGHYTCMQCGTSHLQTVQENILSRIILATYRKFTVATVRFTQNVSCNIFTHPIYQQVANVTV